MGLISSSINSLSERPNWTCLCVSSCSQTLSVEFMFPSECQQKDHHHNGAASGTPLLATDTARWVQSLQSGRVWDCNHVPWWKSGVLQGCGILASFMLLFFFFKKKKDASVKVGRTKDIYFWPDTKAFTYGNTTPFLFLESTLQTENKYFPWELSLKGGNSKAIFYLQVIGFIF